VACLSFALPARRARPFLVLPDGDPVTEQTGDRKPTRRTFIAGGAAAIGLGAAASQIAAGPASAAQQRLIDRALAASTANAALSDVKHVVILMQENRSFDHYFGILSGVRGFSDPAVLKQTVGGVTYPVFDQFGFQPGTGVDASGYMQPFHLRSDPPTENGETTNDVAHDWVTQHDSWNGGAMNAFMTAHLASDGDTNGPVTMGYYTSTELAFYYALANAFTICDGYFCSVLGPTDPNRLMGMSASIDPEGTNGGPVGRDVQRPRGRVRPAELGDHAAAAAVGRGELEGLQRSDRPARA